jgi:hypothetical protein
VIKWVKMSDRPKPFDDQEQAQLIEKSQQLVAEMDRLIERAKALRQEYDKAKRQLKDLANRKRGK